jgi:type I restriction enzyme, S subunit
MNQDRSTTITNPQLKEGYKQTEVGIIPEDWKCVELDQLSPFITSGSRGWADFYSEYGDPFVRITNMFRDSISLDLQDLRYVNLPIGANEGKRTQLHDGDLLISITADIGIISYVDERLQKPAYINQHIALVRFDKEKVNSQFVSYFLSHESSQKWFRGGTDQGAKAGMSLITVRKIKTAIPPLSEQEAIACTLSDVDALIESLDRLLTKKRQIKQGAMQELLRSKEGWIEKSLGEVASFFKGKGLPKSEIIPFATYPCIHYGELFTKYPETILNVQSRTNINTGVFYSVANDVLMPTSDVTPNGLATASCILEDGVILGGDVLVIRIDPKELNGSFLSYIIRYSKKQIMQLVSGTTVYHLYGSDMRKFSFSMPPINEQIEIANIISDMDAEIGSISAKLTKTRQLKQGMMHELLTGRIRLV